MFGSHMRPRSGRNQNRFRLHACTGRQMNSMRVLENGTGFHQSDIVALERGGIRGFQPCNLAVFVGNKRRTNETLDPAPSSHSPLHLQIHGKIATRRQGAFSGHNRG